MTKLKKKKRKGKKRKSLLVIPSRWNWKNVMEQVPLYFWWNWILRVPCSRRSYSIYNRQLTWRWLWGMQNPGEEPNYWHSSLNWSHIHCPKKATKIYLQIPRMRMIIFVHAELQNCITTVSLKSLYTAVDPIKLTGIAMYMKLGDS
jgi:hypothetical protein